MSNTASEIAKFFLDKNWAVFALSIICGFFTSIAIIPAEWRNAIPFENNDWKVVATIVIISLAFYLIFTFVCWAWRKFSDKRYYSRIQKENGAYDTAQAKANIIHMIDCWSGNDYQSLMRLMNNGNKPIKTSLQMGSDIKPRWFKITPAKETSKSKKSDGKAHQEVWGSGAVNVSLKPEVYSMLKEILEEEGSLTSEYRPAFDPNKDSKEKNNEITHR